MHPNTDEALSLFLAGRDTPCPTCGYNLRGLNSTACPECRAPLILQLERIDRPSQKRIAFMLALGALGAARGGLGAFEYGWEILLTRMPLPSVAYTVLFAISTVLFFWLAIFCVLGTARLFATRSGPTAANSVDRLSLRLFAYLFLSFSFGIVWAVGRITGWL